MTTRRILKRSGVYQITNEINGKFYIGSSKDIDNRWDQHRYVFTRLSSPTRSILHSAVKKYGIENFTFLVLEECEPIKEFLLEREQHYIDTLRPAYNLLLRAGSRLGSKSSPETIAKLRLLRHTDEWKQGQSARATAFMSDPEVRNFYSKLRKDKTFAEIFGERAAEVAAKQSQNRTGKNLGFEPWNKGVPMAEGEHKQKFAHAPWTDKRRQKASKARLGKPAWNKGMTMTEEHCRKLAEAHLGQKAWNRGIPHSEETLEKLSQIGRENYQNNPEPQRRATEAARKVNTGKSRPEETKAKISESNLNSEKRKAFAETRRGIARTDEVKQKVSEALQTSEAAAAYHEGRVGKRRGNGSSGHAGVSWDKNRDKWMVRFKGKTYGRYENLEDAVAKAQEVLASL